MNSRVLPFETGALGGALGGGRGRDGHRRRRGSGRPPEPDHVDVRELFRMLWRRRKVVLGVMLAGVLLAVLVTRLMTPQFTAVSKVLIVTPPSQVTGAAQTNTLEPQLNDQLVNSEVAVLQSNVLIQKTISAIGVDRLEAMDPARKPPSLLSRGLSALKGLVGLGGKAKTSAPDPGAPVMTPEERKLLRLTYAVSKDLRITREGQSYVIDIKVSNPDPVIAAELANGLADQYIASQVSERQDSAIKATRFLKTRANELRSQVEAAEAKVEKFRANNLLVDGGTLDAARQQLGQLNNQLVLARADEIAAQARYDRIEAVIKKGGLAAVSSIVSSPALDTLSAKLMDLQRQDAFWAQHYGPQHPERVRLAGEIQGVQHDLDEEVQKLITQRKNDADIAKIRAEALEQSIQKMESRAVTLSRSTIGLRQLERQASAAQAAYQQVLSRLTDTQTQEQMQRPNARVIQRAEISSSPSSPRTKLLAVMGGMVGLIFGVGLVFFLELTATTFRSLSELERDSDLPVLAAVPQGRWKSPLGAWRELAQYPHGLYAERIRHLRTALLMRDGREGARSVMMASSTPGEGKTTTVLALARMAALAGKKVIVVDCDLRRSMLYRLFGWTEGKDFASFINNECGLAEAIHHDKDVGFDVLAASRPQPGAADELAAEWLEPMFETLKRKYDLVLVDAPALLAVSDALVIGQAVDTSIYLVRWGHTPRQAVAKGLSECEEAGLSMSGTVMTMIDPRLSPDVYAGGYAYSD